MHFPKVYLLPTLLREVFSKREQPREPEPAMVMDDPEAVTAFTQAGRLGGPAQAYYLFYCARACLALHGAKRVLDVGCGPGTQVVQMAELYPDVSFVGVDLSDSMLAEARRHAAERGVRNVEFVKGDATRLDFATGSFDGVISVMALHHMPTEQHLERVFREVARVLAPGGGLFMVDFGRLKSPFSMLTIAYEKEKEQAFLLTQDYERSLRAAFRLKDYEQLTQQYLPAEVQIVSTYKVPILLLIKSPDRAIPDELVARLRAAAQRLPAAQRRDLDDLRMVLQLGGLANDPFGSGARLPLTAYRQMAQQLAQPRLDHVVVSHWARWFMAGGLAARIGVHRLRTAFWSWAEGAVARRRTLADERDGRALSQLLQAQLGALKGPLMKFGQMASYVDDRLPASFRELLASLQDRSPALDAPTIRACVEKSLGCPIAAVFAEWEDVPLAAASVAQLHLARLHTGERVVVKVKYPGIEEAIRSDLRLIGVLAPWLARRLQVVANMRQLLDEVGNLLLGECDLAAEAQHQELFRQAFADDAAVVVPRVFAHASSRDVLTMEYIEGQSFADFQAQASQADKNRAAETIARFAVTSIHRFCIYNGDPHPGNYLFLADGRVAFLDFGFVRRWPANFINLNKRQALAAYEEDHDAFAASARAMGYEYEAQDGYREFMQLLRSGPYAPWVEDRPFHYTRAFIRTELGRVAEFSRRSGAVRLSPDHLVVQRVMWGHHAIFADLDAQFNLHQVLLPLLRQPLPLGAGLPTA